MSSSGSYAASGLLETLASVGTAARLQQLPDEVLHRVSQMCGMVGLQQLRLTCKALHEVAQPNCIKLLQQCLPSDGQELHLSSQLASAWANTSAAVIARSLSSACYEQPGETVSSSQTFSLDADQGALAPWKQLQHVSTQWSQPVVSSLVNSCPKLTHLELTVDQDAMPTAAPDHTLSREQEHQAATTDAAALISQHMLPSLQLLASCHSLRSLSLTATAPQLDASWLEQLGSLTHLQHLHLSLQPTHTLTITSPQHAEALIAGLSSGLAPLTQLTTLHLDLAAMPYPASPREIASLPHMPHLQSFSLTSSHNSINPSFLRSTSSSLTRLVWLAHEPPPIATLQRLPLLQHLHCPYAAAEYDMWWVLARMPHLSDLCVASLDLSSNYSCLQLPALSHLVIKGDMYTSAAYCALPLHTITPQLQTLDLTDMIVSVEQAQQLAQGLSRLAQLKLDYWSLLSDDPLLGMAPLAATTPPPASLTSPTSLTHLHLHIKADPEVYNTAHLAPDLLPFHHVSKLTLAGEGDLAHLFPRRHMAALVQALPSVEVVELQVPCSDVAALAHTVLCLSALPRLRVLRLGACMLPRLCHAVALDTPPLPTCPGAQQAFDLRGLGCLTACLLALCGSRTLTGVEVQEPGAGGEAGRRQGVVQGGQPLVPLPAARNVVMALQQQVATACKLAPIKFDVVWV